MKLTNLATFVGACSISLLPSFAFADSITIFNTGNGSTTDGTVDPNWSFTNSSSVTAQALVVNNSGVDFFNGGCCGGGALDARYCDKFVAR
jgi:hypothetical protein